MSSNKIELTSSDGETFVIDEAVARKFQIVAHMIDDDCAHRAIPLANVTGPVLAMAIEFCKKHVDDGKDSTEATKDKEEEQEAKEKELKAWDDEFIKDKDIDTIFKLILAANYLNVKDLLELTCQTTADYIKDKSPEEIREIFGIENDFTAEEEAKVRKDNAWAFEADPKP
ncbi:hypothetical protein CARUB_v10018127mg [Capsella rubella]|uniref:SKP1-like protein n=1 Tax=Capsella rubella TaxID=81985 RepID=R0HLP2_9BRAS|nr:SKP1-like protein 16 [Capsella rubella]EOA24838.1 hypothetical protein CARUB_v10018127mg [Capsella rubella]